MPVKKLGIKWAVFTEAGEFVDMFACRGKAEDRSAELEAAEKRARKAGEEPPKGEGEGEGIAEEEKPQEEGIGGSREQDEFNCPYGDFVSKSGFGLQSHIRAKHGGEKS